MPNVEAARMQTVESSWSSTPIIEIQGATINSETADAVSLKIKGLTLVEPNWEEVELVMTKAGVERADAVYLTERLADEAFNFLLAKAIAERCRRVG